MSNLAIVQVRMGSSRFPFKAMADFNGKPIIQVLLTRMLGIFEATNIVVAISDLDLDAELAKFIKRKFPVLVVQGSENNVFSRFHKALDAYQSSTGKTPQYFYRITGDNPLFMPEICKRMECDFDSSFEFVCNFLPPSFPDGLDLQKISVDHFRKLDTSEFSSLDFEHVTLKYLTDKSLAKRGNLRLPLNFSNHRLTVDYDFDLSYLNAMSLKIGKAPEKISLSDTIEFLALKANKSPTKRPKVIKYESIGNLRVDYNVEADRLFDVF